MNSSIETSREIRGWLKLIQKGENAKKVTEFTETLNNLQRAFTNLNSEMKTFNETTTKSNEFLSRIAKLQQSMEEQTKSANRFTYVVIGLAVLQVVIAIFAYLKP